MHGVSFYHRKNWGMSQGRCVVGVLYSTTCISYNSHTHNHNPLPFSPSCLWTRHLGEATCRYSGMAFLFQATPPPGPGALRKGLIEAVEWLRFRWFYNLAEKKIPINSKIYILVFTLSYLSLSPKQWDDTPQALFGVAHPLHHLHHHRHLFHQAFKSRLSYYFVLFLPFQLLLKLMWWHLPHTLHPEHASSPTS